MKIVMVSSEVTPFAKTGGMADVVGSLPKALKREGHEVYVFMPRYKMIEKKKFNLKTVLKRVRLRLGKGTKEFNIFESKIPGSEVPIYFIDKELYYNRDNLYQVDGKDYEDNAERFNYFSLAVLECLKILDIQPDIIHCNDWQTGLIPLYLKTQLSNDPFYKKIASVYTIHNLAYQGLFEPSILDKLGLDKNLFHPEALEFWGKVNFSKGGLIFSDIINTVSNTYSKEIQTSEYGCGLDGILKNRSNDLYGIINGIDYSVWNPAIDPQIAKNFSLDNLANKEENKRKLLEMNNLPYSPTVPVIGLISRLADQKGFDIFAEIFDKFIEMEIRFVLLGTGDSKYHKLFESYQSKFPHKIKANLRFDAQLAQMIYAGSDMFLMPSHYEPCGLGQLISMKYGTIPIVRATGGLADTVSDIDQDTAFGNGYVFNDYKSIDLLQTIYRAVDCFYNNKGKWQHIQKNAMRADFSWDASAMEYTKIYHKAQEKIKKSSIISNKEKVFI